VPGRRGASVEDPERWVFNRLAEAYASRPGYPEALVRRLAALAGPGGPVADLGAGTGDLAVPLAALGLRVVAVEPARRMLDALERRASAQGLALATVHAAAESTGLPAASFSLAVIADALHWLDPERSGAEISRILSPGGAVAVIDVELLPSPFLDALWPKLRAANPRARPRAMDLSGARRQLFALAAPGAAPAVEGFDCDDALSPDAAAAVVRSLSFVGPALPPGEVAAVTDWAAQCARAGGASWRRRLHLRWVRQKSKGAAR